MFARNIMCVSCNPPFFFKDSLSLFCADKDLEDWISNSVIPEMQESFDKLRIKFFVQKGDSYEARKSRFTDGIFKVFIFFI